MKPFIFATTTLSVAGLSALSAETSRPNVIIILADDLGWNQVGYHGSTWYQTPNIDRIAREGTAYQAAYSAASISSPTRAALMTGKYPARLHLTDFIPGSAYETKPLVTPQMNQGLPLAELTLAERLHERGYINGIFGKWHLAENYNYTPGRPMDPESQGFDVVFHTNKPKQSDFNKPDAHNAISITDNAIKFIRENKNRPFFCYVAHNVVHMPLMEDQGLVSKYANKYGASDPRNHPVMAAMIECMDTQIGRILNELDILSLSQNTIIVFASDNGGVCSLQSQAPFRGGKSMLYQGGIRVPVAIRWPGTVQVGVTVSDDQPIITQDIFYTITEAAGCDISDLPSQSGLPTDGMSLLKYLRTGKKMPGRTLYWHYPHYHTLGGYPGSAIREGNYMLIQWAEGELLGVGSATNLYDLSIDQAQENDIAVENIDITMQLRDKLNRWKKSVNAQEMTIRPTSGQ